MFYRSVGKTDTGAVVELILSLRAKMPVKPLIRIGPDQDGGYLLPDDLDGIRYAFSPGIAYESRFEAALADMGIHVFMADFSVDGPAVANERFTFLKKFIGSYNSATHITLDDWIESCIGADTSDLLLQMDIEGAEYEVLLNCSDRAINQFRIIVLEVHQMGRLFERSQFPIFQAVFRRLLRTHNVVHIHPNNYCGAVEIDGVTIPHIMELTFYRNDRPVEGFFLGKYPHPLDRPNKSNKPEMVLPDIWAREP